MNKPRREIITTGLAATASVSGLAVAAKLAGRYGLIPPDSRGIYGPGETLRDAAQRVLTRHTLAREFSQSQISKDPFANPVDPLGEEIPALSERGICGLASGCRRHLVHDRPPGVLLGC